MDMNGIPFPWVLVDSDLNVIQSNEKFSEAFLEDRHEIRLLNLKDLTPELDINKNKQICTIKGSPYMLTSVKKQEGTEVFFDSAALMKNTSAEIAVGLIFIDNLSDILDNIEEKRQGVIRVIIDNKISDYFQSSGGIVRRFESDKYLFFLSGDLLRRCRENKFSILESIKSTDVGEQQNITLSIGAGVGGKTLKESLDFAKTAVELSLSRGGDQAIIKNGENYEFFGGKVSSTTGNSRVRARAKAYALQDLMSECRNVIVMGHKNADFDSLGACVGIAKIAKTFNRPFSIVLGNVSSAVSPLYERLSEDKTYKERFVSPEDAEKLINDRTLLILVDCHLASYSENGRLISMAKKLVVFDHHRKAPGAVSGYVLSYLESKASSASELICEMLNYMNKKFRLSPLEADALLSGIMLDTKNFTLKTSVQTFEAASYLKKHGADTIRVKLMFKESKKTYFDRLEAIRNCRLINGNMAVAFCGSDCDDPLLTAATAADELLKISDIDASFVMAKKDGYINISMRSLGKINVSLIAEKLGGGGHFETAACQIEAADYDRAEEILTEKINEYLKEEN